MQLHVTGYAQHQLGFSLYGLYAIVVLSSVYAKFFYNSFGKAIVHRTNIHHSQYSFPIHQVWIYLNS